MARSRKPCAHGLSTYTAAALRIPRQLQAQHSTAQQEPSHAAGPVQPEFPGCVACLQPVVARPVSRGTGVWPPGPGPGHAAISPSYKNGTIIVAFRGDEADAQSAAASPDLVSPHHCIWSPRTPAACLLTSHKGTSSSITG